MKRSFALGITLAALLTVPATAQMMHGGAGMGGDDHNPNTRDVCMRFGCVHKSGHMGGPTM